MKIETLQHTSAILIRKTERIKSENESIQIRIKEIEDLLIKECKNR